MSSQTAGASSFPSRLLSMQRRMVISSIGRLGFAFPSGEPAHVHYQTVTDQIVRANPLDPLAAIIFVAVFVAAALLTLRRPAFGLCALIAAVPFALYRDLLGTTVTIPKVVLVGVVLGLTAHAGRFSSLRLMPIRGILIAAGCLIAATALSILQAGSHGAAVRETLKLVEYAIAFLAAYVCFKLDPDDGLVQLAIAAVVS